MITPFVPLEDDFEDIIAKTMRGRHISETEVAIRSGVPADLVARICRGEFCDEGALPKIATALGLDPDALTLLAGKAWAPKPVSVEGLAQFNTPYRSMRVNAFLLWDTETKEAAVFDTGADAKDLLRAIDDLGLELSAIFLTHTHNDHIAELETIRKRLTDGCAVFSNTQEPWPGTQEFEEGDTFSIGSLSVETRTTWGHSMGGTTYVITGLAMPIAVVGDAIFAGSMGGGMVSFKDAWQTNLQKVFSLPDETVICPGHGPMTTVGEEKRANAFFAGEFR